MDTLIAAVAAAAIVLGGFTQDRVTDLEGQLAESQRRLNAIHDTLRELEARGVIRIVETGETNSAG